MTFEPISVEDTPDDIVARFKGSKQYELPAGTQIVFTIGGDTVLDKTVPTDRTAIVDIHVEAILKNA